MTTELSLGENEWGLPTGGSFEARTAVFWRHGCRHWVFMLRFGPSRIRLRSCLWHGRLLRIPFSHSTAVRPASPDCLIHPLKHPQPEKSTRRAMGAALRPQKHLVGAV